MDQRNYSIVIPFHAGDKFSARLLLENILAVSDGAEDSIKYYLQYGDRAEIRQIGETVPFSARTVD